MIVESMQNMRNGRGNGGGLFACRWEAVGKIKMVKMIDQNSTNATVANQENCGFTLHASVRSAKLPAMVVGGGPNGKSRLKAVQFGKPFGRTSQDMQLDVSLIDDSLRIGVTDRFGRATARARLTPDVDIFYSDQLNHHKGEPWSAGVKAQKDGFWISAYGNDRGGRRCRGYRRFRPRLSTRYEACGGSRRRFRELGRFRRTLTPRPNVNSLGMSRSHMLPCNLFAPSDRRSPAHVPRGPDHVLRDWRRWRTASARSIR